MLFGYVRVSTKSQNPSLQIDALLKEGVKREKYLQRCIFWRKGRMS